MLTARKTMEASEVIPRRGTPATTPSHTARHDVRAVPAIREMLLRVASEYREMPGLSLTLPQAARLWGLDQGTCESVLTKLIEGRVLKRALNGTYVRRQSG
jgi:hypothetical protein